MYTLCTMLLLTVSMTLASYASDPERFTRVAKLLTGEIEKGGGPLAQALRIVGVIHAEERSLGAALPDMPDLSGLPGAAGAGASGGAASGAAPAGSGLTYGGGAKPGGPKKASVSWENGGRNFSADKLESLHREAEKSVAGPSPASPKAAPAADAAPEK